VGLSFLTQRVPGRGSDQAGKNGGQNRTEDVGAGAAGIWKEEKVSCKGLRAATRSKKKGFCTKEGRKGLEKRGSTFRGKTSTGKGLKVGITRGAGATRKGSLVFASDFQ